MAHIHTQPSRTAWDRLGILLSGLCAIHCTVLPLLSASLPALSLVVEGQWFHRAIILSLLTFSPWAFYPEWRNHGYSHIIRVALGGLILTFTSFILEETNSAPQELVTFLSLAGSLSLIVAHAWNLKGCQKSFFPLFAKKTRPLKFSPVLTPEKSDCDHSQKCCPHKK
jgi:hypothetical protein